jgi:hypothetical protein
MNTDRCALMNCELDECDLSLKDIIIRFPDTKASYQAKLLIKCHGFSESDRFCIDCFWK